MERDKYGPVYELLRERMADPWDVPDTDAVIGAALDAARAAVADCRVPWPTATGDLVNEGIDDALAAIDRLRGDT